MSKLGNAASPFFRKRHPTVGARPGTLMIEENAPTPRLRMIHYSPEKVEDNEVTSIEDLSKAFEDGCVTWIDVQGFGDEKLVKRIGEIFGIHPLALEDIVNIPQRPKTESFDEQVLIVTRMARGSDESMVDMEQVSIVLGKNYVLTFQEKYGDIFDPVRERIRSGKRRPIRNKSSDYLAYALVDTIVDGFYPVIESIGDHLEHLEAVVMERPTTQTLHELNQTKNMLVNLRRVVWPQREFVNSLMRDESPLIGDEVRVFLRDTYDHGVQTAEVIEMYREMATGLMNTYLSSVANKTNDVMKVLTIMASIFIPLTFIAGVYGMNFEHMPELKIEWAYPLVWVIMGTTAIGMVLFFWKKGWIGPGS